MNAVQFTMLEGGDKVPISKFGLDTSAVVFIGPIKTYLVFFNFSIRCKSRFGPLGSYPPFHLLLPPAGGGDFL